MKNNIATIRKEKGFSQKEFAEMVGISANWMSHIESGNRRPSIKTIETIAGCLGVSVKDIFLD